MEQSWGGRRRGFSVKVRNDPASTLSLNPFQLSDGFDLALYHPSYAAPVYPTSVEYIPFNYRLVSQSSSQRPAPPESSCPGY